MKILICGAKVTDNPLKVEVSYLCFTCQAEKSDEWDMLLDFFHEERSDLPAEPLPFDLVDVLSLAQRFQEAYPGRLTNCFYVELLEMSKRQRHMDDDDSMMKLIDPHGLFRQKQDSTLN